VSSDADAREWSGDGGMRRGADKCRADGCQSDGCRADGCQADGCSVDGCRADGCQTQGCEVDGCQSEGRRADGCREPSAWLPDLVLRAGPGPLPDGVAPGDYLIVQPRGEPEVGRLCAIVGASEPSECAAGGVDVADGVEIGAGGGLPGEIGAPAVGRIAVVAGGVLIVMADGTRRMVGDGEHIWPVLALYRPAPRRRC